MYSDNSLEKVVYIAVHPHNAYGIYDRDQNFVNARNNRLNNENLGQVLLVHYDDNPEIIQDINETKNHLDPDSTYWQDRVFLTHSGRYASENKSGERLDWYQLSEKIKERFPADKYVFWGAEVHKPPDNLSNQDPSVKKYWENRDPYGCVLFYYENLDLPNKEIDLESCLIRDK